MTMVALYPDIRRCLDRRNRPFAHWDRCARKPDQSPSEMPTMQLRPKDSLPTGVTGAAAVGTAAAPAKATMAHNERASQRAIHQWQMKEHQRQQTLHTRRRRALWLRRRRPRPETTGTGRTGSRPAPDAGPSPELCTASAVRNEVPAKRGELSTRRRASQMAHLHEGWEEPRADVRVHHAL